MNITRNVFTTLFTFMTLISFSQRGEVRDAEDAHEDGNYKKAFEYLDQAKSEGVLQDKEKWQVRYYIAKGYAHLGPKKGVGRSFKNLKKAAESFEKSIAIEKEDEAVEGMKFVRNALVQNAVKDQQNKNFSTAAEKLYKSYELADKQDTIYLYYAASNYVQDKKYDKAVEYYKELMDLNFNGARTEYYAVNKETGKNERFENKNFRDLSIKSGDYKKPSQKETKSKKPEIAKNIALIYIQQGKKEKALDAIEEAKANNPDDPALLQAEADIYYQMGNVEKYDKIMKRIVKLRPNDENLYYNLGVASDKNGKIEDAKKYYKKAIELDPEFVNAYINLATAILAKEDEIVKQMNELGMSDADQKKYEKLKEKKKKYYKEAMPYLKEAIKLEPKNIGAIQTLMNMYYQLGQSKKAEKFRKKLEKVQSK